MYFYMYSDHTDSERNRSDTSCLWLPVLGLSNFSFLVYTTTYNMQSALLSCLSVCLQMEPPVALPAAVTCNKGVIAFMAMQISPADNPYEAGFSANNLKTGCNKLNWHHSRVPAHIHARHSVYNSCGTSCCTSCNANGSLTADVELKGGCSHC